MKKLILIALALLFLLTGCISNLSTKSKVLCGAFVAGQLVDTVSTLDTVHNDDYKEANSINTWVFDKAGEAGFIVFKSCGTARTLIMADFVDELTRQRNLWVGNGVTWGVNIWNLSVKGKF